MRISGAEGGRPDGQHRLPGRARPGVPGPSPAQRLHRAHPHGAAPRAEGAAL